MCVRCGENMRDADDGRKMDRPLLLYGKIFSHMDGTGHVIIYGSCIIRDLEANVLKDRSEPLDPFLVLK